jgi:carboxymethylenebutenolidase
VLSLGDPGKPAVIVLPAVFGVVGSDLEYARRLAANYRVLVVDYWARAPVISMLDSEAIGRAVALVDDGLVLRDVVEARGLILDKRIAVLGFCLGGLYARMAASTVPGLTAAVEFYGRVVYPTLSAQKPIQPLDLLPGRTCSLLCHFGTDDPIAPEAHVAELESRLSRQSAPARLYRYVGCGHAFMDSARPNWNGQAATLAWARTERFLEEALDDEA